MAKSTRGAPHNAPGKKKAKSRAESHPVAVQPRPAESEAAVESPKPRAEAATSGSVIQFRPRGREGTARPSTRAGAVSRAIQQVVDYSYVYADLKIIGAVVASLLVILIALTFVIK
jgi:hypothetical protein